ncbi:MAG: hypothetical protein JW829_08105 [Pirellulales bacterium]|nr:hypothetical protein [Pirellulales bacterium]
MMRLRRASFQFAVIALISGLTSGLCPAAEPSAEIPSILDIGAGRQVFIDRTFLAEARGVELVVHPPRKTGEKTIAPEYAWEQGGIGPYSSVLKTGDLYYMWYHAMDTIQWDGTTREGCICLALSEDGIHWERPKINLIRYGEEPWNNIVVGHGAAGIELGQDGCMVFLDTNAPENERYRMVAKFGADVQDEDSQAIHVYSSPDGIHWKLTHPSVVIARPQEQGHHLDSQNVIFWDERIGKYVAYVRKNRRDPGSQGRAIARGESDQLGGFPDVQEMPIVFGSDQQDPFHGKTPVVDFYMSAAIKYPWADNAYYMFPTAYYHYVPGALAEFPDRIPINAGPLDTQFSASRDGILWNRYDRRPFVPLGMQGEFDWASARVIRGLVPDVTGRQMYLYYRASDWLHGWDRNEANKNLLRQAGLGADQNIAVISRLVLRRDGFLSVRGAYTGGEFTTPPLRFEGNQLVLNIDTSATGMARVGILDQNAQPIEGFSIRDCDRIHTCNEINRPVTWHRKSDVSQLSGQIIRLQFMLRNCDLYAFQFNKSSELDQ